MTFFFIGQSEQENEKEIANIYIHAYTLPFACNANELQKQNHWNDNILRRIVNIETNWRQNLIFSSGHIFIPIRSHSMKRKQKCVRVLSCDIYLLAWNSVCSLFSILASTFSFNSPFSIFIAISSCVCICHVCHSKDYFPFLFSSLFLPLRCVCASSLWSKSNYMLYCTYMWLWFGCISICVQFFFCFFFFFVIFCSHLATAAHWILIGFTVCNGVYVSMAIVCYGIESDAGNRHVHVTQDFWHWTYTR